MTCVALIPARSGSQRIPDKNIREIGGHPLIAYTITAALDSGVFSRVVVSTDSERYAEIAKHYGAEVPWLRPAAFAGYLSPDIAWVQHALRWVKVEEKEAQFFSILRPDHPFRQVGTIRRAWSCWQKHKATRASLRAVSLVTEHPAKMWRIRNGDLMLPLLPFEIEGSKTPWHNNQYARLPKVYVQNASLEIAWIRTVDKTCTISGSPVLPFITEGYEGFDLNNEMDWRMAELLIDTGEARLPELQRRGDR